jgi:putative ABC transport system substrate-binding protein
MKRREFIGVLGSAVALPAAARAQQPKRVGVLMSTASDTGAIRISAFIQQLRKLGWIDGQNLHIDFRSGEADEARVRAHAAELVALSPDVILAVTTVSLIALQRLSPTAPIVFIQVSDPVTQGFVLSMARPGGNITGFANNEFSVGGKWVDLLKQMVPGLTHMAALFNPQTTPQAKYFISSIEAAAPIFGVKIAAIPLESAADIEPAIADFARQPNGGLIFPTAAFPIVHRKKIVEVAARYRIPAIYATLDIVQDGGLMCYGPENTDQFRQAGIYVDRILKGVKAGDLPVQTPMKYALGINLKTARDLGIEVPVSLLLIADEQVE